MTRIYVILFDKLVGLVMMKFGGKSPVTSAPCDAGEVEVACRLSVYSELLYFYMFLKPFLS